MPPEIKVHWMGYRKNSGRGAVWTWFTESNKKDEPNSTYWKDTLPPVECHIAWGNIGKKLHFEPRELTYDFLLEAKSLSNNFRQVEPEKFVTRWGKSFNEELSMYLLFLKLKG